MSAKNYDNGIRIRFMTNYQILKYCCFDTHLRPDTHPLNILFIIWKDYLIFHEFGWHICDTPWIGKRGSLQFLLSLMGQINQCWVNMETYLWQHTKQLHHAKTKVESEYCGSSSWHIIVVSGFRPCHTQSFTSRSKSSYIPTHTIHLEVLVIKIGVFPHCNPSFYTCIPWLL